MFSFYTPWKHQKTKDINWKHWSEMGQETIAGISKNDGAC